MSKPKNASLFEKAQNFIAANNEKTIAQHDANSKKFQAYEMPVQKAFKTARENINIKNIKRVAIGAFAFSALSNTFNIAPANANSPENKIAPTLEQKVLAEAVKETSQVKGGGVRAGLEAVTKDDGKFSTNEIGKFVETRNKTNGFIDSKKDQAETNAILNKVNAGETIIQATTEIVFNTPEAKAQDEKNKLDGKPTEGQYYAQIIANAQKSILQKQITPQPKTPPTTPPKTNIDKGVVDDLSFNPNTNLPKNSNAFEAIANTAGSVIKSIDQVITPGANATEVKDIQKIMGNDKLPTLSSKYEEMITPLMEKHTSENKALQVQLKKDLKTLNNLNSRYQAAKKIVDKSPNEGNKANLKVLENNARNQYAKVAKTLTQLENISSSAEAKSNLDDTLRTLYGAIGGAAAMATIWGIYSRVNKNKNKHDLQQQQGTIVPPGKLGPENNKDSENKSDEPTAPIAEIATQDIQLPNFPIPESVDTENNLIIGENITLEGLNKTNYEKYKEFIKTEFESRPSFESLKSERLGFSITDIYNKDFADLQASILYKAVNDITIITDNYPEGIKFQVKNLIYKQELNELEFVVECTFDGHASNKQNLVIVENTSTNSDTNKTPDQSPKPITEPKSVKSPEQKVLDQAFVPEPKISESETSSTNSNQEKIQIDKVFAKKIFEGVSEKDRSRILSNLDAIDKSEYNDSDDLHHILITQEPFINDNSLTDFQKSELADSYLN